MDPHALVLVHAVRRLRRVIFELLALFVAPVVGTYNAREERALRRAKRLLTPEERRYLRKIASS